jgi:hypothetical protein
MNLVNIMELLYIYHYRFSLVFSCIVKKDLLTYLKK